MKILIYYTLFAAAILGGKAQALTLSAAHIAKPAAKIVMVRDHGRRHHGLFSNWCAYNCYAVPRCYHGGCLGRYGYSRFAYDEDLPLRYRFDRDASPVDNADAFVYRFTGEPIIRAFERLY